MEPDESTEGARPAGDGEPAQDGGLADLDAAVIERARLNDTEEGSVIAAGFVKVFGDFVTASVRPILVEVAAAGGEPQLLVNGLAELLRSTADNIEFPLDHPRAGSPNRTDVADASEGV